MPSASGSQLATEPPPAIPVIPRNVLLRVAWLLMVVSWLIVGLSSRHELDADGVAYADIARACMHGNWRALINGYWSPLYPALLSQWLSMFRPSLPSEITFIRLFMCLTLVGALASFRYFLNELLQYRRLQFSRANRSLLPDWALTATGYCLFFWSTVYLTPASKDPPDVLVLAFVLLAAALVMRIARGARTFASFMCLGAILGSGYLSKAAMFPLAFVFLAAAYVGADGGRKAFLRSVAGLVCFLIVSGPFVFELSKDKGRLTFGDSGAIAYAMAVNYVDISVYWQGQPPGSGVPKHPVRKILDQPPVYEYAAPIGGSYPLWYDHSYWYDGVHPHLEIRRQLNVIHIGLRDYFDMFFVQLGCLVVGFLVLLMCGPSLRSFLGDFLRAIPLWGPAVAGFGMYALVHVEPRFLSGFVILLWASCFAGLRMSEPKMSSVVVRGVVIAVLAVLGLQIAIEVGHTASESLFKQGYPDWEVAKRLNQMRIAPDGKVSYIGDALTDHVWAHLAGVTLVSEVPLRGVPSFWAASQDLRSNVYDLFARTGAKAVITTNVPPELEVDGWQQVGGTKYYILQLPQPAHP